MKMVIWTRCVCVYVSVSKFNQPSIPQISTAMNDKLQSFKKNFNFNFDSQVLSNQLYQKILKASIILIQITTTATIAM